MVDLSPRQKTASAIAGELRRLGVQWVLSPLPLADGKHLRFMLRDGEKDPILAKLGSWGWNPWLVEIKQQVCHDGFKPAGVYQIDIEADRDAIVDDRIIKDDIGGKEKPHPEVVAALKAGGWRT